MKWIPVSKQAPETCLDVLATLQTADGRIVVKVAYSVSAEKWRIPGLPGTVASGNRESDCVDALA